MQLDKPYTNSVPGLRCCLLTIRRTETINTSAALILTLTVNWLFLKPCRPKLIIFVLISVCADSTGMGLGIPDLDQLLLHQEYDHVAPCTYMITAMTQWQLKMSLRADNE